MPDVTPADICNMKFVFYVLAITLFSYGCEELEKVTPEDEIPVTGAVKYVIPAGEHYCNQPAYDTINTGTIKFRAIFDSSAIYQTKSENNQADINKLYGMSDCGSMHHTNSARFGWVWNKNKLEIWAYTYTNSKRNYEFVDTVSLNIFHTYEIVFTDSSYVFKLNDSFTQMPRACQKEANGYKLYPYFGGDETAPHEITIIIDDIE